MKQVLAAFKAFCQPLWIGLLHLAHRLLLPTMILVIVYAILVSSFIALTPWVKGYQMQLERLIQDKTQQKVVIGDIKTSWYGLYPVLKFENLTLSKQDGKTWACHECWLGVDLLRSLLYWHLHPGMLYIDGVTLDFKQEHGQWTLKGLPSIKLNQGLEHSVINDLGSLFAFAPEKILIKDMQLRFSSAAHPAFFLKNIRVLGQKKSGEYHWSAEAEISKQSHLQIRIDMPLLSNLSIPDNGRIYFQTESLNLTEVPGLASYLKEQHIRQLTGEVMGDAWLDWREGQVTAVHSHFTVEHFILDAFHLAKPFKLEHFSANALWQKQAAAWQLAMDNLELKQSIYHWANNRFLMVYQPDWDTYHLYFKDCSLDFLAYVKTFLDKDGRQQWPWLPLGHLKDLQLNIKDKKLDYALMQFSDIHWPKTKTYPGVKGLSGGLSWETNKVHLELASSSVAISFQHYPDFNLQNLHAILGMNKNSQGGTNLEIERLVLARPDLALTVQGEIDNVQNKTLSNARLSLNWSMYQAERYLAYLPLILKPGNLLDWLQKDVKQIRQTSGEMVLNGLLKDFPYDNAEGEFSVHSHLYGVDLFFAKNWPLTKQIDAELKVQGRELLANIDKGILNDMPIEQVNIRVPYLGQDKEVLLVHGQMSAELDKMLSYLKESPLKNKAHSWSNFDFKGLAHLDLKLDIPLFKGRDDIYAMGHINFDEQDMDFKLFSQPLKLQQTEGFLDFNADGLIAGEMQAKLGARPIALKVEHHDKSQDTLLHLTGDIGVQELKHAWLLDKWHMVKGHFPFEASILMPNEQRTYWDMEWHSSLKGMLIDLPLPWHKTKQEIKPLDLGIRVLDTGEIKMNILYQAKDFNLSYFQHVWDLALDEEDIKGHVLYSPEHKKISAKLQRLYLDSSFIKSQQQQDAPWQISDMPSLDLSFEDFRWDGLSLGDMNIQAGKDDQASYQLEQLKLTSPFYELLIHGNWTMLGDKHHIDMIAQMMISNLSKSLELWHVTPAMQTKQGLLDFRGTWDCSLNQAKLENLKGSLELKFKKGNITHLDKDTENKIGLGKLLSIASLQTLPRRLQLDFSDLSDTGFTFDIFKGHFDLQQGLLSTTNAEMDGPIAYLKMHGGLNVLHKWYDLELQVYPYIAASLPVAATIVGGPLAGVATWAASHVINKGMQQVSAYTYKITGPWEQPVVQQVGLIRKKKDA